MKKTLHIDESLSRDAKAACGATTDTDTVRLGLEALVRRGAHPSVSHGLVIASDVRSASTPRTSR